jgi:methionyl-tRNA formyltransferase
MSKKLNPDPQTTPNYQQEITINPEDITKSLKKIKFDPEIKVVFFGTPVFVNPIKEALDKNFKLLKVISESIEFDKSFQEELKNLEPDLMVVAAYGKILPKEVLDIPRFGALNIHPSLLPKYRGASPIQQAILNGDKITGVTIIKMDQKMDHGPIVAQEEFEVFTEDTFESLANRLFQEAAEMLVKVIPDFVEGKITPKEQNHQQATFSKLLKKEDGYFELDNPPENLDKMVRAYHPWPSAWTRWSPSTKVTGDKNGKIVKLLPNGFVQLEGKKAVPLKDFLNGYPDFPIKTVI